jgi:hypothetical protein
MMFVGLLRRVNGSGERIAVRAQNVSAKLKKEAVAELSQVNRHRAPPLRPTYFFDCYCTP